jgi:Rap1a immunity proteins
MLPLCKTWLKIAIERNRDAIKQIIVDDPSRLTTAGMCAGEVVGVVEAMRTSGLICPPDGVTNDQLVRIVVTEIESHPEGLHEDFIVPASAIFMATWPCRK